MGGMMSGTDSPYQMNVVLASVLLLHPFRFRPMRAGKSSRIFAFNVEE
jgi:hypothetical protein